MIFDEVLEKVGEFGTFQKRIYILLGFPAISVGSLMMMVIVVMYTPQHRCKIPGLDNDTFMVQGSEHEYLLNRSIPIAADPTLKYDRCHVYHFDEAALDEDNRPINGSSVPCEEWVYDDNVFYDTFTTKANLVCGDALKTSHVQMLFFFGVFVGDMVLGLIGDMLGRKKALYLGLITLIVTSVSVTWAPEFYSFAVFQFLIGASAHGAFLCMAVISLEIVGPSKRVWTGMLIQVFFAVGVCYLALMAFLIRRWSWINLSVAIPCVTYLTYWWWIPESPRWLLSKGKHDESVEFIRKAAKVNKVHIPEHMFDNEAPVSKGPTGRIWHVFRSPVLLRRTMIFFFNWMIVSMTYYGVTMNAGNMAGDFYLNFLLMGLAEILGLFIGLGLLDRIGRRWSNAGSMIVGGLACLATVPTVLLTNANLQPLTIALAVIGKAGAASAFGIVYIFTAELLPTVVRNAAMGSCSCAARIGGMLAPYIAKSGELIGGKFGQVEPLVIFGALSIIAGLLLLLLPETLHQQLPDTIEEGEQFGRKRRPIECKDTETPFIAGTASVL